LLAALVEGQGKLLCKGILSIEEISLLGSDVRSEPWLYARIFNLPLLNRNFLL
jgi:hypothetical protein